MSCFPPYQNAFSLLASFRFYQYYNCKPYQWYPLKILSPYPFVNALLEAALFNTLHQFEVALRISMMAFKNYVRICFILPSLSWRNLTSPKSKMLLFLVLYPSFLGWGFLYFAGIQDPSHFYSNCCTLSRIHFNHIHHGRQAWITQHLVGSCFSLTLSSIFWEDFLQCTMHLQ